MRYVCLESCLQGTIKSPLWSHSLLSHFERPTSSNFKETNYYLNTALEKHKMKVQKYIGQFSERKFQNLSCKGLYHDVYKTKKSQHSIFRILWYSRTIVFQLRTKSLNPSTHCVQFSCVIGCLQTYLMPCVVLCLGKTTRNIFLR